MDIDATTQWRDGVQSVDELEDEGVRDIFRYSTQCLHFCILASNIH
jgi:hypothetical protein